MARPSGTILASLLLSVLAGCGEARRLEAEALDRCARCHGGLSAASATTDPLIGAAPPRALSGRTDDPAIGAHVRHLSDHLSGGQPFRFVACASCHAVPATTRHLPQAQGRVTFGGLARAAWPGEAAPAPAWDGASCSASYCHGAFPGGNAGNAPTWDQPRAQSCGTCHGDAATGDPLPTAGHPAVVARSPCGTCHADTVAADGTLLTAGAHLDGELQTDPAARHPAGWMVPGSPDFHGPVAAADGRTCQRCHAATPPATVALATCADCHRPGGLSLCSGCHGSDRSSAPPRDLQGHLDRSFVGVGAHQPHLTAPSGLAAPLYCEFCHTIPDGLFAEGHLDGQVTVSGYTGQVPVWRTAATDPGWTAPDAATATCATSYCHGAFPGGNADNRPLWTQTGQAACGSCHGLPPGAPHPPVGAALTGCAICHPATVDASGALVRIAAGGKHLDGAVEVLDGHASGWMVPASPTFHALSANEGLSGCTPCHGEDLAGGFVGVGCGSCHDASLPPGVASWQTSCVMCHGGVDNATGAPPRTTWGAGGDAVRVGAHTAHLAAGVTCAACHVVPPDARAPGHVDPSPAEVIFSGLATAGGASPAWDRAGATCVASYCHGATLLGGSTPAPRWTGTDQAACGGCHGLPPAALPGPSHPVYVFQAPCVGCHPGSTTVDAGGASVILPGGQHLDGAEQHTFTGHVAGWAVPGTAGTVGGLHSNQTCMGCGVVPGTLSMNEYYDTCTTCHGRAGDFAPDGGSSRVSCGACHPAFFTPAGQTSCSFCH
jgi:predicted CxxxxCH...CXXCH cytochrome family protein